MRLRAIILGVFFAAAVPAAETREAEEFFESRIRPLLVKNCHACHTGAQSGGLRLDSRQSVLKGGKSGPAMVPGRPEESLLIQAVSHTHERLKMPPPGKLAGEEIAALEKWIRQGAVWPESPGEFFAGRVWPVLEKNCLACHAAAPQGGLRMDTREALLKGGASGPAIQPGDPEKSLLVQSVRQTHARFKMPPGGKLPDAEIADLAAWIQDGAQWSGGGPATAEYQITAEQRAFWSFQPPVKRAPPGVAAKEWAAHPIDRFVYARLAEKRLKPAPEATRRTLIRRASYDLTGLPPAPEEVEAFVADRSPDAWEKVIDRLLASPHYGERWGRHWLDLARYADSAGDSADYPVPQARLYRDYVIDSFNRDKPYDQFLREQIAGDLMPAAGEAERWERVVATGYLAMARRFSVRPERNMHLTIEDTIDNLGKTVLGLSIACARCHDHKYDPIPTKDYYALYGIFDSTRYPFAGSENIQEQQDLVPKNPAEAERVVKPFLEKLAPVEAELKRVQQELSAAFKGEAKRSLEEIRKEAAALIKQRRAIAREKPWVEAAFAVAEAKPRNARVQLRGEPKNLGEEAPRGFLRVLGGQRVPEGAGSGRLQLAEWLTDPHNPLTARVAVNRIWQRHLGKGLVATASDFGKRGKMPTHPELLDYLAVRFRDDGWSFKKMHKLIMTSRAYRMAADGPPENQAIDPANEHFWKFNRRRLDAEAIRDSLLLFSGMLDTRRPGQHPFPDERTWTFTQHKPFASVYETRHRSVYLMTQRIQKHPYLAMFDGADPNMSTAERAATITPIQALFMMNSQFVHEQAQGLAERLMRASGEPRRQVDRAHRIVWGRPPTAEELRRAGEFLERAEARVKSGGETPAYRVPQAALESYVRALMSSNEFIFLE